MKDTHVLIWSYEHDMWWRPRGCGYTSHITEAGAFKRDDAERPLQGTGLGGHKGSVIVPFSDVESAARSAIPTRRESERAVHNSAD